MTQPVTSLRLDELVPSPLQYRDAKRGLAELAATITLKGILQPLVVRRVDGHYEIVCGERRWRAAPLAGLERVPVVVRELDDMQARECMLIENGSRSDASPLEEADCYKVLRDEHHMSVDDIAAKVGRSLTAVYQRLKLTELLTPARHALEEGKLSVGAALVLARIASKEQPRALATLLKRAGATTVTASDARWSLQSYTCDLRRAPFDPKDPALVPAAGSCGVCPFRAGNQVDLFAGLDPEGEEPETCTKPTCFEKKKEASWQQATEQARAKGVEVLDKKTSVLTEYGAIARGYVRADDKPNGSYNLPRPKTWKQLAGKGLKPMLVRDPSSGAALEVYKEAEAKQATRETSPEAAKVLWPAPSKKKETRSAGKSSGSVELELRVAEETLARTMDRIDKIGLNDEAWRLLFDFVTDGAPNLDGVAERRGAGATRKKGDAIAQDALWTLFRDATPRLKESIIIEMLVSDRVAYVPQDLLDLAKSYDVADTKTIRKEVAAAAREEELITWRPQKGTTIKGKGAKGRLYTLTVGPKRFEMIATGNGGSRIGVGAEAYSGPGDKGVTLEDLKKRALEHERHERGVK